MLQRVKNRARLILAERVNQIVTIADEVESALRGPEDETPIRAIVRQRDELQTEFEELWRTNVRNAAAVNTLSGQLNRANAERAQTAATLIACQRERDAEYAKAQRYSTDAGALQRALIEARDESALLTAEIERMREQVSGACAERDEARRRASEARAELDTAETIASEAESLRERLDEVCAERDQALANARALAKETLRLQATIGNVRSDLRALARPSLSPDEARPVMSTAPDLYAYCPQCCVKEAPFSAGGVWCVRCAAAANDLAGLAAHASKPEPAPRNEGAEVTPALIDWLRRTADARVTIRGEPIEPVIALIQARAAFGLAKYGQPLRTRDGRDSVEDARQEAGDLLQYLFKARLNGENIDSLAPVLACVDYVRAAHGVYFGGSEN